MKSWFILTCNDRYLKHEKQRVGVGSGITLGMSLSWAVQSAVIVKLGK